MIPQKTIEDLNWNPKVNISEGLKEFAEWYNNYYK